MNRRLVVSGFGALWVVTLLMGTPSAGIILFWVPVILAAGWSTPKGQS